MVGTHDVLAGMKLALASSFAVVALAIVLALADLSGARGPATPGEVNPIWAEAKWPFPMDQWGTGRSFVCTPSDCGSRVEVHVRPKIGFCNCATGVADDAELERVGDLDLVSAQTQARGDGRTIKVGWMSGRSRAYRTSNEGVGENLLSVGFNDECDAVVALVKLGEGDPAKFEPAVIAFLNSTPMVLWAKKELGLEFIKREW